MPDFPHRRALLGGLMTVAAFPVKAAEKPALIKVTTLDPDGPGSLKAALETRGPRIVVFEVGGVIDLEKATLRIREPFVTIAGETAPAPGITLIKGGVSVLTHHVVIRHIAVRPGAAGMAQKSGFEPDGLSCTTAHDVVIEHCSFTWAVDEALSASGPRFEGATPDDWRRNTSHSIIFRNNLIGESLHHASHSKGAHSMGSLLHDNVTNALLIGNLYAHNNERHPLIKGGAQAVVVNNVFVNPGSACAQYTLVEEQWAGREAITGKLLLRSNVMRSGVNTRKNLGLLKFGGAGDLDLHAADNIATYLDGSAAPTIAYYQARPDGHEDSGPYRPKGVIRAMPKEVLMPQGLSLRPAADVEAHVYKTAGARPWARDAIDARIVAEAKAGKGRIIDNEGEGGGYPQHRSTRRVFRDSYLMKI
ncbi:pectate lyase [Asticcacaulis sp. AND118]|uniref:pectate lyase n=1 Tax=Asticcacaulis sp. AND118 TaxID=2840468 RepID=UPI001CFFB505|nr:pectate lyase [Asticcacaulis sp. AND118]UDF05137.1 pectate lyase [Asticcacaulis sp. AND118]